MRRRGSIAEPAPGVLPAVGVARIVPSARADRGAANPTTMPLDEAIRKRGFRRWYERQLCDGHAHLVTGLLSLITMAIAAGGWNGGRPRWCTMRG